MRIAQLILNGKVHSGRGESDVKDLKLKYLITVFTPAKRHYATLWDVTLRCKMLRYVVRCYAIIMNVTLRYKTLHYVERRYTTL